LIEARRPHLTIAAGTKLGRSEIRSKIGAGSMGTMIITNR
jgi:hypothetical protein